MWPKRKRPEWYVITTPGVLRERQPDGSSRQTGDALLIKLVWGVRGKPNYYNDKTVIAGFVDPASAEFEEQLAEAMAVAEDKATMLNAQGLNGRPK
jgi:hypothetical protein